ncbi:MAG TPA: endonuclease/exonuclease/phosphatase family protein, partial [Capsulimonadaceae bacterium]|nr:endonuclease/exonuclease/phosphatase family protein [Capsulimonadaceae bacterium]
GEFCPILYKKSRFAALEGSTFWLSENPELPGSISWGCRHSRICSWVRLADRQTFQAFYVYNTHLDNESLEARQKGIAMIMEQIRGRVGLDPVVLVGDFNAPSDEPTITTVRAADSPTPIDALASQSPDNQDGTYHEFTGKPREPRIDYIFVSPEWQVAEGAILTEKGPIFSSDHFPIMTTLHL